MPYLKSELVTVFPSVYRTIDTSGKFTSEENFVNIIKSITDKESYILDYDTVNSLLRVVLGGYYFTLKINLSANLWLAILVEQGEQAGNALVRFDSGSVINIDEGDQFFGICYENNGISDPAVSGNYDIYKLQICDSQGNILESNRLRLSAGSVEFDGGSVLTKLQDLTNSKQNNLKVAADSGLYIDSDSNIQIANGENIEGMPTPNYIKRLDSLPNKGGSSGEKLIYFDSDGIATNSKTNIGRRYKDGYGQSVYVQDGVLTEGQRFFISSSSPTPNDGSIGDVWFKYSSSN